MFGQDDRSKMDAWLREQAASHATGMNPSGVAFPTQPGQGYAPAPGQMRDPGIAHPDMRPALPQQAPGGQFPAAWLAQRLAGGGGGGAAGIAPQAAAAAPAAGGDALSQIAKYNPSGAPVAQGAASAAGAAAPAAASAGIAGIAGPIAAVGIGALQRANEERRARADQIANIYAQQSGRYPHYGMQAARFKRDLQDAPGPNYVAPFLNRRG